MSTAAAAAVVYAVVVDVVALPARCRPPALNLQPRFICYCFLYTSSHRNMGIVRGCAAAAAAASVVLYSLRSFPHRDRCLPLLLLLLFTWYTVVDVVAVPARCRPPALNLQPRCFCYCVLLYELTPRYGYSTRMRCCCRCCIRCSVQPAFLSTPRQMSTFAVATVVYLVCCWWRCCCCSRT